MFTFAAAADSTFKFVNQAVKESNGSKDGTNYKTYLESNPVDLGVFEYAKANTYFIAAGDFTKGDINYTTAVNSPGNNDHQFAVYNSDKYELLTFEGASGYPFALIEDKLTGEQFGILSCRGTYKDDKVSATLGPIKTKLDGYQATYPNARIFVSYNARLSGTYSTTGNTYPDILDTYLTENTDGPTLTSLGRGAVGGFYIRAADVPTTYSVADLVVDNMTYTGTVATVTYPSIYRIIFEDYDGTGLQTNMVTQGGSVTPPTPPERTGFTFTGWDHTAAEFASVSESFTATAQYEASGNSHVVTYLSWDGTELAELAVEDGACCVPPAAPARADYTFDGWTKEGEAFDLTTPVTADLTLTAAYTLVTMQETATAADFLRRIEAGYPEGTTVKLTADIDLDGAAITTTNLYGTLDGNGYTLTGLKNTGRLFDTVYGTIKNLTLDSVGGGDVSGDHGLLGLSAKGATVVNCVFTNCQVAITKTSAKAGLLFASVSANDEVKTVISNIVTRNCTAKYSGSKYYSDYFGGIVAQAAGCEIVHCRVLADDKDATAIGDKSFCAGGIVGYVSGTDCVVRGCYNEAKVVTNEAGDNNKGAGGIVGGAGESCQVYDCTNAAAVVGSQGAGVGGIVARTCKRAITIGRCVNRGSVTSYYSDSATNPYGIGAAGILGGNWGNDSKVVIFDCANYGAIDTTTNNCHAGGIVADYCYSNGGTGLYLTNCFNYGSVTSEKRAGGIVGYNGYHTTTFVNCGNAGAIVSTAFYAGGLAGGMLNDGNRTYQVRGFLNAGAITGGLGAGLVFGSYADTKQLTGVNLQLYSGVLAGSVTATGEGGTAGTLFGAKAGDYTFVLQCSADENCRVLQQGLYDYYNNEGGANLETPITAMSAADLTNGNAKTLLDDYAAANGYARWVQCAAYPELALFGTPVATRSGLMIIVR